MLKLTQNFSQINATGQLKVKAVEEFLQRHKSDGDEQADEIISHWKNVLDNATDACSAGQIFLNEIPSMELFKNL